MAGTGAVSALGLYERWKKRQVSWPTIRKAIVVAVLVAFYMAWQDEHGKLMALKRGADDPLYGLTFSWVEVAPTNVTEWAAFPTPVVKTRAKAIAKEMVDFEKSYKTQVRNLLSEEPTGTEDADRFYHDRGEKIRAIQEQEAAEFRQKFQPAAGSLIVEMLERLKMPFPLRPSSGLTKDGDRAWGMGELAGDSPVSDLAAYLTLLASKLPND